MVKKAFDYDVTVVLARLNPNLFETTSHRCLYGLWLNKEIVNSTVSWSYIRKKGLIVDTEDAGVLWSFDHALYEAKVVNKELWLSRRGSEEWIRVYSDRPDYAGLERVGAKKESQINGRGYRYVYFQKEYDCSLEANTLLSQHTIILAFDSGVDVLKTLGVTGRLHEIHHKDGNKLNNHPSNLELLTIREHRAIHGVS